MKTLTALTLFMLFSTIFGTAQDRPSVTAQANTLFVGADGKFESAPDTALIQFNISAESETSKAAYELAAKQAEQTRQILRANGIEPKAAEIGYYSIQPEYDWKNPKRKLIGYRVTSTVTLKLKDFAKIGPITQQLADADVSTSQSLNYTLENIDEAKTKAVDDAYRRAHLYAEALAHSSGRALGELSYASVDTAENVRIMAPVPHKVSMMRATETVAPTEEFTPQTVSVTAHVNAMFTMK